MTVPRWQDSRGGIPTLITLVVGLVLGWGFSTPRPSPLLAGGGDRYDESILTSGPAYIQYNESAKIQVSQDSVYFLDYRAGKLIATMPSLRQTSAGSTIIENFGERDLVADFKIDLDTSPRPHFLMTTGSISNNSRQAFGDGWAPLFVFETTTRQVAAYKTEQKTIGTTNQIRLILLEVKPFTSKPTVAK